jgi:hypothetical protein
MIQTFNLYGADSNVDSYYLSICQNICDRPIHEVCVFFIPLFQLFTLNLRSEKLPNAYNFSNRYQHHTVGDFLDPIKH